MTTSARLLVVALVTTAALFPALAHAQRSERREVDLLVGEQYSLPAQNVRSYSVGVEGIIDVRVPPEGDRFVLVGLQPGTTTLLLIFNDRRQIQYFITVSSDTAGDRGIRERDNIRLDFYFIQIAESYQLQIGLGWPTAIGGAGVANIAATVDLLGPTVASATATISSQPLPRIDLLQKSGWARVMRQAAVITANGTQANFSSGEEVNIVVAGGVTGQLQTITVGTTVGVVPRYDRETGRIELRVTAEVSDFTEGEPPGRLVSNVQSIVNLEMGQALVLGGLIADSEGSSRAGLPGLSQIPILGLLFGSSSTQRRYSQNALFIVPTVVDVMSQQARGHVAEAMDLYWEFSGDLDEQQLIATPPGIPSAAHPEALRQGERNPRQRAPEPEDDDE